MNPISSTLISRLATLLFSAALLSGCFGTGEGPDRIEGTLAPPPPPIPPGFCDPLFNFEDLCGAVTFNNFEGGEAAIIDNPDPSGSNTSDKVARMLKFRGPDEDTFGGTSIPLDGSFDFANGTAFTMQVWASRSVPVLFKFEGLNQERSLDHSGSSGWEELCFDFTGSTAGNAATSLTVIFDISVMGDAEANPNDWTFYFDEIVQVASCDGGGDPGDGSAPTVGAPAPTQDAANVISLYSDAYTDEAVVWPTDWSDPNNTTSDITIDGGLVKEALDISFFGIEFQVDASSMTHLHMDVWTPDATSLVLKLVDFGGDGFGGMNADTEGVLTFDAASTPALGQGTWVSLDIPLQDFLDIGLGSTADLNQIVVDPGPDGTDLFIDNVYFYNDNAGDGGNAPTTSAPTPTQAAGSVISLYSDVYTDEVVTWPTPWSDPNDTTSDVTIDGGLVKEHLNVNFFGIEFQVDGSSMTHLHMDVWTPDADSLLLKLVDFGGDGFGGMNADTEGVLTFDAASTPALGQGTWVSLDIPLQDFLDNGLGSTADLNQIVVDPTPDGTALYIDNVYFYDANAGGDGAFVNGNFETGDFTGWTLEQIPPDRGSITLDSSGQGGRAGTVARLMAAGDASGTNDVLISQVALGAGTIVSGDTIDVSFDLYGSLTGAGGVVFVEVIFLNAAGEDEGGRNFVGPAAPYTPTSTWTNHSGTVIAGTGVNSSGWDVSGGVTLQLKAACGAIAGGCGVDASFDNVTFTVNGE